ncbi:Lrp/AsnC family transcriptional regulator [Thermodesulforhabdus norvegica]|uniref:siroheme decarboxylase n=1 Tax=Thermodesulforhabdus norvegica TaxID=39841 RepID=A0A1I4SCN3_9BACT|nr:Lrp/AsnC family transcriptional regulator [Thermodesulforhabdus norvegica]SFM62239.1 DNA-binding transcriptional regulator, Lrp family [Thermodesulforhabdus norvegica]
MKDKPASPVETLDRIDRLILDRIQKAFPVESRPYEILGDEIGIDEDEVLRRLGSLKRCGIVRQISAIFHTTALGYSTSLVAMAVPEKYIEAAVREINAYPGVSHNYLRPGLYNIWFTIAVPPGEDLPSVVSEIAEKAGGWPYLILPALKKYKLAVILDVLEEGDAPVSDTVGRSFQPGHRKCSFPRTDQNIRIVRAVQEDLPEVKRPFMETAERLDMTEQELLAILREWLEKSWIRRYAAVLNHRRAGFEANGMVVWSCPEGEIDRVGRILATFPEVSHCYHRPAHPPEWPYNIYAMIHGRTEEECRRLAERLSKSVGLFDYDVLFSEKEFKKIRLKLFWDYEV